MDQMSSSHMKAAEKALELYRILSAVAWTHPISDAVIRDMVRAYMYHHLPSSCSVSDTLILLPKPKENQS